MTAERIETARGGHEYRLDGVKVPGVTTVLGTAYPKPWLKAWALKFAARFAVDEWATLDALDDDERVARIKGAPDRHRDARGDIGREVHAVIEGVLAQRDDVIPFSDDALPYVASVTRWLRDVRPISLLAERPVFSREHCYAGTFDALVEIDGRVLLVDWKTSTSVMPEHVVQLAAYRYAEFYIDEQGGEYPMPEVDGCAVVHIQPEATVLVPLDAGREEFDAFLSCLALQRFSGRSRVPR